MLKNIVERRKEIIKRSQNTPTMGLNLSRFNAGMLKRLKLNNWFICVPKYKSVKITELECIKITSYNGDVHCKDVETGEEYIYSLADFAQQAKPTIEESLNESLETYASIGKEISELMIENSCVILDIQNKKQELLNNK